MAIRFGSGALQFKLAEGWEQLPDGWLHIDVAAVCTDSSGKVCLYCRGDHPVIVYERDGTFLGPGGKENSPTAPTACS